MTVDDAERLALSWQLALRAQRKSPQTLKSYGEGVRQYLAWCADHDVDPMVRANLNTWTAALLDAGSAAATARARQLGVRRFASWAAEEGELPADPFLGVKSPKLDERVVEPLSDDELRAMLKACIPPKGATPAEALRHRRDEAMIRLMLESGMRAGEVVSLQLDDVDLAGGMATVRRGKGGKGRVVPFGPEVALALDRYLRLRRSHRLAARPDLWVGDRGKGFSYDALHKTLAMRADQAGVTGFHPHRLRHTAAHRWLAAGGSESGLMAVAGWTRPDTLMRYTKAQAAARAADEALSSTSASCNGYSRNMRSPAHWNINTQVDALCYDAATRFDRALDDLDDIATSTGRGGLDTLDRSRIIDWLEELRQGESGLRQLRLQLEALQGTGRVCRSCGGAVAGRADRVYCSSRCRVRAHRLNLGEL